MVLNTCDLQRFAVIIDDCSYYHIPFGEAVVAMATKADFVDGLDALQQLIYTEKEKAQQKVKGRKNE